MFFIINAKEKVPSRDLGLIKNKFSFCLVISVSIISFADTIHVMIRSKRNNVQRVYKYNVYKYNS